MQYCGTLLLFLANSSWCAYGGVRHGSIVKHSVRSLSASQDMAGLNLSVLNDGQPWTGCAFGTEVLFHELGARCQGRLGGTWA